MMAANACVPPDRLNGDVGIIHTAKAELYARCDFLRG